MNIAIDIGNSRVKVGIFIKNRLEDVWFYSHEAFQTDFRRDLEDKGKNLPPLKYLGWVSVGEEILMNVLSFFQKRHPDVIRVPIRRDTPLPVENAYKTPETLGMDRIVSVCGALAEGLKGPLLVIDAGTAVTYDFMDRDNRYQGGGISPGLRTRFRALHDYTAKLPMVELREPLPLVGGTTHESILSGVAVGFIAEVEGFIRRYREQFGDDTQVFLTGGDAEFLGNHLKNINFADANLVLKGINAIIAHNQLHA